MKLNLNEQVKELLIKVAEQDQKATGNICALSHYANVAILAYYSNKTIQSKDAHAGKQQQSR